MIHAKQIKDGTLGKVKTDATLLSADGARPLTADWDVGAFKVRNVADPLLDSDAATQGFVLRQVITGRSFRELVLVSSQLTAVGLLPAIALYVAINPSVNDTFVLTDGTTTETFTFKAVRAVAFEVAIGVDAASTASNLGAAIVSDSAVWSGVGASGLDRYFAALPAQAAAIFRKTIGSGLDRVFGTLTAPAGIKVVAFSSSAGSDYDPSGGTESNIPAADPGAGRFGIARAAASLRQNETHLVADTNAAYTWDGDDQVWRQTDIGAITFAAPSVSAVSDAAAAQAGSASTGLRSDCRVVVSTGAPSDTGSANAQGSSTALARQDHVHRTPMPVKATKGLTASVTVADGDSACATTIGSGSGGPALGSWVGVRVNGVGYTVGDGVKTTDCFFSNDGGVTARAMSAIAQGDSLRWNGSIAGFQLDATDRIDFLFEAYA